MKEVHQGQKQQKYSWIQQIPVKSNNFIRYNHIFGNKILSKIIHKYLMSQQSFKNNVQTKENEFIEESKETQESEPSTNNFKKQTGKTIRLSSQTRVNSKRGTF